MIKIKKGYNLSLIFTLIAVFLWQNFAYSSSVSHHFLRVPMDINRTREELVNNSKNIPPEWWERRKEATYYEKLEVDNRAPIGQIRKAYRFLAMKWHPDRNPGDKLAEEVFKELAGAYKVLSDQDKRASYDLDLKLDKTGGTINVGGLYTAEELGYFRQRWKKLFERQTEEMLDMLRSAGLTTDTMGRRRVSNLFWGRDGNIYLGSSGLIMHDPGASISAFNLFDKPEGREREKEIFLGVDGECYQIFQNPVNDNIAIVCVPKGRHYEGAKYPRVIMVFGWDELMRNTAAWLKISYEDELYRLNELLDRGELEKEGLVSLPGCIGCLVLHSIKYPVSAWSFDGKKIILIGADDGTVIDWDIYNNSYAISQLPLSQQNEKYKEDPVIIVSPGGLFAAVSYTRGIVLPSDKFERTEPFLEIWDVRSKKLLAKLRNTVATNINWDAEGNLIFEAREYIAFFGNEIYLWNWSKKDKPVKMAEFKKPIGPIQISPNGKFLCVTKTHSGDPMEVIDLADNNRLKVNPLASYRVTYDITLMPEVKTDGYVISISWAPNNSYLVTGYDAALTIWEVNSAQKKLNEIDKSLASGETITSIIKERFPDADNISFADLDTGTGEFVTNFTNLLKKHFKSVDGVGVELLQKYVSQAQENGHNVVHGAPDVEGDYENVGLLDNSRDIVTINNIESRPLELVRQADRIVKERGLIIVTFETYDIQLGEGNDNSVEANLIERGYNTKRIFFPKDYPHSVKYQEADFVLIAWKGKFGLLDKLDRYNKISHTAESSL